MSFDMDALKRTVLARYPYFGSVAAALSYEETDRVRTIGCDGKTIFFNPEYMTGLNSEERLFVLAHELCHVAFGHIRRSRGRDKEVWKAATDAVINQLLKRDGLQIIRGGIDYPEAIDYDAESFYEILLAEKLEIELVEGQMAKPEGSGGGDGSGSRDGDSEDQDKAGGSDAQAEDDHSLWEDAAEQEEEEEREREEKLLEELEKIKEMTELTPDAQNPDEEGQKDGDSEDESDQEELGIVSETVSQSGNSERRDLRTVSEIGSSGPIIDWRLLLRDTINYGVDWSFTHATLEDGIVRPALEERPMPETEIVLDTSWSVDEDLLRNFLRECKNILQLSKLKAGCFDTVFYGFHDIRTEEDIENMPFEGGGGTDFDTAVGAFTLRVDNRIIFTDGEAPMPKEPLNVIWMVYGGDKPGQPGGKIIDPPGGTVIHITEEQLKKLKGAG